MRALLAAGLLLAAFAMPVAAAKPADPYLTLDTPGPYHYGGTIQVTTHGVIPGSPGENRTRTWIKNVCYQNGEAVWIDLIFSPAENTTYTLWFANQPGTSSLWTDHGGGPAHCQIWFGHLAQWPKTGTPYTIFEIDVEA